MEVATRLRSTLMRVMTSRGQQSRRHAIARLKRKLAGRPPCVHYFHEVSDPYSHLAVQKLDELQNKYDIAFEVHLTSSTEDPYRGDASRYYQWALNDAISIASYYGVTLSPSAKQPEDGQVRTVENELSGLLSSSDFAATAIRLGESLWSGQVESAEDKSPNEVVVAGNTQRADWGHYAGGTFYFEGEWYLSVDRLYLLEERLLNEGYGSGPICVPRPTPSDKDVDASSVTLEYFPSLRSPYTAISFDRTMAIVDRTGVNLKIRPVMPMMMRGVPAPREKGMYVLTDSAREARAAGEDFGKIVDPFGEPVKRAFSLLPFVVDQGKTREFVGRYLDAAWKEGVDVTQDSGLEKVISEIGLDWSAAKNSMANNAGEGMLEDNVNDMLSEGLWGVPSFRVTSDETEALSCWGQDRLWLVEQAIKDRAA